MESSSLMMGSSKRAKAPGNAYQIARCLVDGCNADLSQCRDYHRRHKVCELHSKTAKVTIGGREQRFCQQCSRFHSLVEFDEGKRSCRKRLDGHNRRRRKPQPEASRNSGMLFPDLQGTRLLSFNTPQVFPSAVASSNWSGVVKPENDVVLYNDQLNANYFDRQKFQESSVNDFKGANKFQFMQNPDCALPKPLFDPDSALGHSNNSNELNQVINSNRALSLLSSAPSVSREIGLSHMVQPDSISQAQSFVHNLDYSNPGQFPFAQEIENKPVVSESDSHVNNNATIHVDDMFQIGPGESSTSGGSHQTLTFLW